MSFKSQLKKAWRSGEFKISEEKSEAPATGAGSARDRVADQMLDLAQREAGDANSCSTVHKEAIMKLAPFVKFREEKFGAVLFETRSEKVYTLSRTGAAVVKEVIAGADAAGVVENLKNKYEDAGGKIAAEATAFLQQLKEKGLVTE